MLPDALGSIDIRGELGVNEVGSSLWTALVLLTVQSLSMRFPDRQPTDAMQINGFYKFQKMDSLQSTVNFSSTDR